MNSSSQLEPMANLARIGEINGFEAAGDAPQDYPRQGFGLCDSSPNT